MKAAPPKQLPVYAGDFPNPVGFVDIGMIADDGLKLKHRDTALKTFGGRTIATRRNFHLEIKVEVGQFDRVLWGAITGDPLAYLAWQFRAINPHWYLNGDPDA